MQTTQPLRRVLVTGATGFIGCRLAEILAAQGIGVVGSGRVAGAMEEARRRRLEACGIPLVAGSITEAAVCAAAVAGCSHVIHLAAAQHEMNIPRQTFFDVNVEGTRLLLQASKAAGVTRFVYGSTIGVYGDGGHAELDEASPVRPLNDYGASKLEAEAVVKEWYSRLPTSIARISETYGPGDGRLLKLFSALDRGLFVIFGDGQNLRQLVYVDDLAAGLSALAVDAKAEGETFLLAGTQTMTTVEMVAHVATALGRSTRVRQLPLWPMAASAALMESMLRPLGIQSPLHRRRLDFFRRSFVVSSRKAHSVLGYQPGTSFLAGAKLTADWYRAQGLL